MVSVPLPKSKNTKRDFIFVPQKDVPSSSPSLGAPTSLLITMFVFSHFDVAHPSQNVSKKQKKQSLSGLGSKYLRSKEDKSFGI